jgi:hypothetical protein
MSDLGTLCFVEELPGTRAIAGTENAVLTTEKRTKGAEYPGRGSTFSTYLELNE